MATKYWTGDAVAVAQVDTLTVGGTVEAGDVFITTINGKSISVSATTTSTSTTATEIRTALNASTIQEFQEITWTVNAAVVTGTAVTAGKPFTVTVTTTESGGGAADAQTYVRAASVASAGPNHWDTADNWSDATVPVSTDTVYIDHGPDILYGLNQSAVTLTLLAISQSYTGKIGLPNRNTDALSTALADIYEEYRDTYLRVSATTLTLDSAAGSGSGRIKINTGANAATVNVNGTGQAAETGIPAFLWKGTHASNVFNVTKGDVGIAFFPAETATVATIRTGYQTNQAGDVNCRLGDGCTLTNVDWYGGTGVLQDATTLLNLYGGTLTIRDAAHAEINVVAPGTLDYRSSGTITTLRARAGGTVDFTKDVRAKTVTNCEVYAGATIAGAGVVTFTNGIDLVAAALPTQSRAASEVRQIDLGSHFTITKSAI